MAIKFYTLQEKLLDMRNKNCSVPTLLKEGIKWQPDLDEVLVLRDVLRILSENNLPVEKSEIKKALNLYYNLKSHGNKVLLLDGLHRDFQIKQINRPIEKQGLSPFESLSKEPHTRDFEEKLMNGLGGLK